LERIELFGQPEAAAEASSRLGDNPVEAAPRRVKRDRRWPSMRVMGGVIAAGIVAGLFLVTYKPGLVPDFASSNSAANESADEMATAFKVPTALKSDTGDSPAASEVRTEAADDTAADDGASKMGRSDSFGESDATPDISDNYSTQDASASEQSEGSDYGVATTGGGSNSSEGSSGAMGTHSEELDVKQKELSKDAAAEQGLLSPDGKLSARAEDYSIHIYTIADQKLLNESPRKNGKLANLVWSEDSSQLTYEVHVEKGAIETYIIDVASGLEKKAGH
jgi:hypothetical protein